MQQLFILGLLIVSVLTTVNTSGRTLPRADGCSQMMTPKDSAEEAIFTSLITENLRDTDVNGWPEYGLSRADTASITMIRDDSVCARAWRVIRSTILPKALPGPFFLAHVGDRYVAQMRISPDYHSEFLPLYIFDARLANMLYPCPQDDLWFCKKE